MRSIHYPPENTDARRPREKLIYIILSFCPAVNRSSLFSRNFFRRRSIALAICRRAFYNRDRQANNGGGYHAYEHHFHRHCRRTGSGKTTLTRHLKEHFGDAVTVIGHDSYYKRQDGKTYEERSKVNYDHPDAFETSLLVEHLKALKAGRSIQCPVYSYVDHNRTDETVEVFPTKVIIVEGILIFQDPTLRDMFDIKIFVETDADVRILRRALRDIRDRGRTLESVITQYLTTVKPMHEQYVEPSRKYADIIVLEGGHNLVALDMIMQRIASHIASED